MMVVEANVGLERRLELSECGEGPASDPLGLQGVEERLYVGIVLVATGSVHAGSDPVPPEDRPVAVRPILNPAIGVKDERLRRRSAELRTGRKNLRAAVESTVRSEPNAQPTMRRELTSMTAARKQGRPLAFR